MTDIEIVESIYVLGSETVESDTSAPGDHWYIQSSIEVSPKEIVSLWQRVSPTPMVKEGGGNMVKINVSVKTPQLSVNSRTICLGPVDGKITPGGVMPE